MMEELTSDASETELHDLTVIDSHGRFYNMVSQHDALDSIDLSASCAYRAS